LRLRILLDRCSIEVFAEGGRIAMTNLIFPPADAHEIQMYSKGSDPGPILLKVSKIRSVYPVKAIGSF
jgi:fructan beta-fructosidase